jgi:hypothetical protein
MEKTHKTSQTPRQTPRGGGKKALVIGVGLAALGAAAYTLLGPRGSKNRKMLRGWALKMYGEIMDRVEDVKDLSEPIFEKIVEEVSKKYAKLKNIDQEDVDEAIAEIRRQWKKVTTGTPKRKSKEA